MTDKYDEDLYENPFFIALQNQFSDLLSKASANGWLVCIPQYSCVSKGGVSPGDVEDHILVPREGAVGEDEVTNVYQSLSSKDAEVKNGVIYTKQGYQVQHQVGILFEETFHTDSDDSYRVLCVHAYLNSNTGGEVREESAVNRRPTSYEQCIDILWNHTGGLRAKDHLDKMLNTFALTFDTLEGQRLHNIVDVANAQFTKVMQYVLKDSVLKRTALHNITYMENVKIAVETYYMHAVFRKLFRVVTACVGSDDAEINKLTRNLSSLTLSDLGVKKVFSKNVSSAKVELSRINNFSTPVGRLFCVKRVVAALTKMRKESTSTDTASADMMTTDDFLPILIYLIVKSEIPNWTANLSFMTHFHFAKVSEDAEFGFYLASIEAALEHIKSGKVKEEVLNKEKIKSSWQGVNGVSEDTHIQRQASGPNLNLVEEFFQLVEGGDEEGVRTMLEKPKRECEELTSKLCHPLCSCDKCEKIHTQIKSNSNLVTAYTRDTRGYTALHIAAACGQPQLIDVLVTHGAIVDAADYLGLTPLHLACQNGLQNAMLLLLHFGSNILEVDGDGNTPLHLAAGNGHEDCVKALIFFDSSKMEVNKVTMINAKNDIGNTALHLASKWGYESIVRVLIENGADPGIKNRKKQSPLSLTQNVMVQRMLTLASRGLAISSTSVQDMSIPLMSPRTPTSPSTPLSPSTPHSSGVKRMNSVASTASSVSADRTFKFETAALDDGVSEKVRKKVEKLFRAISLGDTQLVKYYLGLDFAGDSSDNFDDVSDDVDGSDVPETPCHPLCQCSKCHSTFKTSPAPEGSLSINCRSTSGYTPLHMAVLHQHPDLVSLFLAHGALVNVQNHNLMTSLHLAACVKSEQMLSDILTAGGKVAIQDINDDTPLHIACANGLSQAVTILLQHNASISARNKKGNTSLHEAAMRAHTGIVHMLLQHGASVFARNKEGLTPAQLTQDTALRRYLEHQGVCSTETAPGTARHSPDTDRHQVGIRDLFAAFEQTDLEALQTLATSIRTFSRRDSLRKTETHDLSAPKIDNNLARNLSIRTFDPKKLKHIDSQDKSEPLYIYKLAMQAQKDYGAPIDDGYCDKAMESDSDDDLFKRDTKSKEKNVKRSVSEMDDLVDVDL